MARKLVTINLHSMTQTEQEFADLPVPREKMISKKEQWIQFLKEQLDHSQDMEYKKLPKNINRVFHTDQDDRDIADHILKTFLKYLETGKL